MNKQYVYYFEVTIYIVNVKALEGRRQNFLPSVRSSFSLHSTDFCQCSSMPSVLFYNLASFFSHLLTVAGWNEGV